MASRELAKSLRRMREKGLHFAWMVDEGGTLVSDNPMIPDQQLAIINVAEKGYLTLIPGGDWAGRGTPPFRRESVLLGACRRH